MSPKTHTDRRSHRGRRYLVVTSIGALGVVYGDIGTSPLYALRESFVAADGLAVTRDSVFGILSLMMWALILIVMLKYLIVVMRADNGGEGGIMALTALISGKGTTTNGRRGALILIGLFGTALLYGDGMITPAISVLSALEGIEVAVPALHQYIVPLAAVVLVALFSIQRQGTATVGAVFGPVMIVWFTVLGVLGLGQILEAPEVLGAFNPMYGLRFVAGNPKHAFLAMGAIFLVVTGSEALYADMGHFGKRAIRIGWFTLVYPGLVLNYLGQGALILGDPAAIDSPFYRMAPEWFLGPLIILATAATVIASQALISGAYSLTLQAVQLGYLPRVRIDHTSAREIGQIYVSVVNWALMIGCVSLVFAFGSASGLAAAYGIAVTTTMVITTVLLYIVMRERWKWPLPAAISVTALFLIVDLAFFAANVVKIPQGGWFPLIVGAGIFTIMTTWKRGRATLVAETRRGDLPIERFIGSITEHPQQRVPGTAIFLFPEPGATPPALLANLRHNEILHETIVLLSVKVTERARVQPARRFTVHDLTAGFHQVVVHFGFMEQPDVPAALANLVAGDFGVDLSDVTFFLGRETVVPSSGEGGSGMATWREHLYAFLHRNATGAAHFFELPPEKVIEVGITVEI